LFAQKRKREREADLKWKQKMYADKEKHEARKKCDQLRYKNNKNKTGYGEEKERLRQKRQQPKHKKKIKAYNNAYRNMVQSDSTLRVKRNEAAAMYRRLQGLKGRIHKEEEEILGVLIHNDIYPSRREEKGPCGTSVNLRRADFVFESPCMNYTIILEIDEDEHHSYNTECEVARVDELVHQYPSKPLKIVRFAPTRRDKRKLETEGNLLEMNDESKQKLVETLKGIIRMCKPGEHDMPLGYEMLYIGYSRERVRELEKTRNIMYTERLTLFAE
jgi:hypothetical protein